MLSPKRSECRICGEPLAADATSCPICLEPRRPHKLRLIRTRAGWRGLLFAILFAGTCGAMLRPAIRISDSQTHYPIDWQPARSFPLIVMNGHTPNLVIAKNPHQIPPLPAGSSYLIPSGADRAIQDRLNERLHDPNDGMWVLNVERIEPQRQRIELYWMNDGYSGGAYEATATSITPLYRKLAGPLFAAVFGGLAALMSAALWLIIGFLIRRLRQIHDSSAVGP
jgi:hypothetical protein